jgi:hypothetical protein
MVKKKATQVKKKMWRRQIDTQPALKALKEDFAASLAQTLDDKSLFFTDSKGSERLKRKAGAYPTHFYTPNTRVSTEKVKPAKAASRPTKGKTGKDTGVFDLWDDEASSKPKDAKSHIPAVLPPMAGQSYNPKDEDKERVLLRIVEEENAAVIAKEEQEKVLNSFTIVDKVALTPEQSEEEEEEGYLQNPPVSAEKKLTEKQRRHRLLIKQTEKVSKSQAVQRKVGKQADQIPTMLKQLKAAGEVSRALKVKEAALKELERTEESFGLSAPKFRMGTFTYKAPLTDADLTGKSSEALRKIEVKGNLVESFFDSVTRRKLVDRDEGKPKRPGKEVMKNRWSGEVSNAMQEARKKRKLEEASGSIALQKPT